MELDQEIKTLVSRVIKIPEEKISPETNFRDLGVDSLLAVEILAGLDKKYNLDIPEEYAAKINTLNDLIAVVKKLRARI